MVDVELLFPCASGCEGAVASAVPSVSGADFMGTESDRVFFRTSLLFGSGGGVGFALVKSVEGNLGWWGGGGGNFLSGFLSVSFSGTGCIFPLSLSLSLSAVQLAALSVNALAIPHNPLLLGGMGGLSPAPWLKLV